MSGGGAPNETHQTPTASAGLLVFVFLFIAGQAASPCVE